MSRGVSAAMAPSPSNTYFIMLLKEKSLSAKTFARYDNQEASSTALKIKLGRRVEMRLTHKQ
jgi:hypothetical protein